MAAIKALQQWCKIHCDGYRDVAIINMTTSFRDGLAFCALIHKFRPDLINFESLSKDNVYENNHLAFCVAEEHLGIPALLDAEDMVALPIPDRLSILTYVSQYYNYFNSRVTIGGAGGVKRPAEGSKEEPSEKKNLPVVAGSHTPAGLVGNRLLPFSASKGARENCPPSLLLQESAETHTLKTHAPAPLKTQTTSEKRPAVTCFQKHSRSPSRVSPSRGGASPDEEKTVLVERSNKTDTLNSKCAVCGSHVHLVQRHLLDGKLYHRSCFKSLAPGQGGTSETGHERDPLLCSPSCCTHRGPAKPAEDPQLQVDSGPFPPGPASVLCSPVGLLPRPVDPGPAPQPWMDSAQRTQEARRKFFLSSSPVPQPSNGHDVSSVAGSAVVSRSGPEEECVRDEGNCNNNNKAYSCGLTAQSMPGSDRLSAVVPEQRKQTQTATAAGGGANRLSPAPNTPSPGNKEALQTGQAVRSSGVLAVRRSKLRAPPTPPALKSIEDNGVSLENKISSSDHVTHQAPPCATTIQSSLCGPADWGYRPGNPKDSRSHQLLLDSSLSNESHKSRRASLENSPGFVESGNTSLETCSASERIKLCHIPMEEITKELQEIEESLSDLEKEGVDLESRLRSCEEEGSGDVLVDPLMVDWFRLIQKKQSYIRRESELMYIARSQGLEEQQPGVEGELRTLMNKPEHLKSTAEMKREAALMKRLVEIVNDRNAIVDGLEQDRLREEEEDHQLHVMLQRLDMKTRKAKRNSSFSKLFRRRSKNTPMEE